MVVWYRHRTTSRERRHRLGDDRLIYVARTGVKSCATPIDLADGALHRAKDEGRNRVMMAEGASA